MAQLSSTILEGETSTELTDVTFSLGPPFSSGTSAFKIDIIPARTDKETLWSNHLFPKLQRYHVSDHPPKP